MHLLIRRYCKSQHVDEFFDLDSLSKTQKLSDAEVVYLGTSSTNRYGVNAFDVFRFEAKGPADAEPGEEPDRLLWVEPWLVQEVKCWSKALLPVKSKVNAEEFYIEFCYAEADDSNILSNIQIERIIKNAEMKTEPKKDQEK